MISSDVKPVRNERGTYTLLDGLLVRLVCADALEVGAGSRVNMISSEA